MIILSIFTPPKKMIPNEAKQHQPLRVVEAESVTHTVKLSNASISVFYTKYQPMACLIRFESKNCSIKIAIDRTQG